MFAPERFIISYNTLDPNTVEMMESGMATLRVVLAEIIPPISKDDAVGLLLLLLLFMAPPCPTPICATPAVRLFMAAAPICCWLLLEAPDPSPSVSAIINEAMYESPTGRVGGEG